MVLAGLLIVALSLADAVRRPDWSWRSQRERTAWLVLLCLPLPLLFVSVVGPFVALAVVALYLVRRSSLSRRPSR